MDLLGVAGNVLFTAAVSTIKDLLTEAIKQRADLRGANLYGANLRGADLYGAYLYGANLYGANLHGAYLYGANLYGANLHGANLYGANLYGANLHGADLHDANLRGADLYGAYLYGANLYGANLHGANLYGANLYGANLHGANLYGANLHGANLHGANLHGANLRGADLYGANLQDAKNIPDLVQAQCSIVPEGSIVGWKKCKNNVIVKLLIPQDAQRSNATGRKCRASHCKVLRVFNGDVGISQHDEKTIYRKGEVVTCDRWNEDHWVECGGGIHFYLTRIEAENH